MKANHFVTPAPLPSRDGPVEVENTTFQMLGNQLPIGMLLAGEHHRSFSFRRYNMALEAEVADVRAEHQMMSDQVLAILRLALKSLGPYPDFQDLDESAQKLLLHQMWLGDVMYLWFQLRRNALGDDLSASVRCPSCSHQFPFKGDVSQADVRKTLDGKPFTWFCDLHDGIEVGDKLLKRVTLQPARWSGFASGSAKKGSTELHMRLAMIRSSVRQLGDEETAVAVDERALMDMTKRDMELISREVDNAPGPDLTLEGKCPKCKHDFAVPVNWAWDFFFTAASMSRHGSS